MTISWTRQYRGWWLVEWIEVTWNYVADDLMMIVAVFWIHDQ